MKRRSRKIHLIKRAAITWCRTEVPNFQLTADKSDATCEECLRLKDVDHANRRKGALKRWGYPQSA